MMSAKQLKNFFTGKKCNKLKYKYRQQKKILNTTDLWEDIFSKVMLNETCPF